MFDKMTHFLTQINCKILFFMFANSHKKTINQQKKRKNTKSKLKSKGLCVLHDECGTKAKCICPSSHTNIENRERVVQQQRQLKFTTLTVWLKCRTLKNIKVLPPVIQKPPASLLLCACPPNVLDYACMVDASLPYAASSLSFLPALRFYPVFN